MAVTWLHVSDFHLNDKGPYNQEVILRALVASVKRFREHEGRAPDLVLATGDIAASGQQREYGMATLFFDDLLDAAGLTRDRLFVVPGNHDVDRKTGRFLLRTLDTCEDADDYFDPDTPKPHLSQKFQAFAEWYDGYFRTIRSFPTNTTCSPVESLTINGTRVAILPMNSALFSIDDHDHEKLFIGRRCLEAARGELSGAELAIALIHHPLDWLSPVEQANIESVLETSVDLMLQGHFHQTAMKSVQSAQGVYLKLAAGAAYQTRRYPNCAMYATFESQKVTIYPIRYEDTPVETWCHDPRPSFAGSFPVAGRADALPPVVSTNKQPELLVTLQEPARPVRVVRILVASPGDVAEERSIAFHAIHDWNARHRHSSIRLEAVLWESHAAPENRGDGKGAQEPINRQLVASCDAAIGIFWMRIGTPTPVAPGGAVEELRRVLEQQKPVMLYFSNAHSRPDQIDPDQIAHLKRFRQEMQSDGLVWEYQDRHEFETQLPRHLDFQIEHWFPESLTGSGEVTHTSLKELYTYQETLRADLGSIVMLGVPDIDSARVTLDDTTFVPLRLSDRPLDGERCCSDEPQLREEERGERLCNPDELMRRAFHDGRKMRLLLIIGDPGSGKTTLLKYYALCALDPVRSARLGFTGRIPVFYLPLRELVRHETPEGVGSYDSLPLNLSLWYKRHHHTLSEEVFTAWLGEGLSLVLLDGLDEISNTEKRKEVCRWIDNAWSGFRKALFVVTSRGTGYRKEEEIELEREHDRADVLDFRPEQQEAFVKNWFTASFLKEPRDAGVDPKEWDSMQCAKADERTTRMIAHLRASKNKGLRQLSAIPMILQIMVILWKEKDYMPETRVSLYRSALDYMLGIRDKRRGIAAGFSRKGNGVNPVMTVDRARRVLEPVAWWMQATMHSDKAGEPELFARMQEWLDTLDDAPSVEEFCDYLVKRAGVLVCYGKEYLFRHKTFREYLASVELVKNFYRSPEDIDTVVASFGEDWWDEPVRFFMTQADAGMFDLFMMKFFASPVSDPITEERQLLLRTIIEEAPQKKADALCTRLLDAGTTVGRQRTILDCIRAVNKASALGALLEFRGKGLAKSDDVAGRAEEVILALGGTATGRSPEQSSGREMASFRNHEEDHAEYIPIPGGSFIFSKTEAETRVEDRWFARYTVTNRRYRAFIAALRQESGLPEQLEAMARSTQWGKGFGEWLREEDGDFAGRLRSTYDDDRKFGGDEQPVVGVSWYAAQCYCLWQTQRSSGTGVYRLPTEIEWEWAAGGRRGEAVQRVREYPWPDETLEPNPKLLNYNSNVGATTPVHSYPEGATPEGLYNMAGNVWEWTESWWDESTRTLRVLRGGSWGNYARGCRSAFRFNGPPGDRYDYVGFRLVFVPQFTSRKKPEEKE